MNSPPMAVFSAVGAYSSSAAFVDGFAPAIATAAGISLLGALAALALPAQAARLAA